MKEYPLASADRNSRDALRRFLQQCQTIARKKNTDQLVSICVRVEALDPLGVLESIYEPEERHFYMEHTTRMCAVAGADSVFMHESSGPERFTCLEQFRLDLLGNTHLTGDLDHPRAGPLFFVAASFHPKDETGSVFPVSQLFVPRWQVVVDGGDCLATANVRIPPTGVSDAVADRIWRAHSRFRSFAYATPSGSSNQTVSPDFSVVPLDSNSEQEIRFYGSVQKALAEIRAGHYRKLVLARPFDLTASEPFHPLRTLNRLREKFPDCYAFSVANGRGQSFIGASPECLVRSENGILYTEALAGSAPRGHSASEDAQLGRALLQSTKDRHEQEIVLDSIVKRLREAGLEPRVSGLPRLKKLSNVQHLQTMVEAKLTADRSLLPLLASLHPTPAVGGQPRNQAIPRIAELEGFSRGLYAGPIGWINARGEGDFLVAIRSALIDGKTARLFAGAGIVEGSEPGKELSETTLKLQALLQVLVSHP